VPLSDYHRVYHGFEHAGLRVEVDLDRSRGDDHLEAVIVDVASGRVVGEFTRYLHERDGELYSQQDSHRLDEEYRGRGFTPALIPHSSAGLRALGVRAMTITAHNIGALIWGGKGFEFDLYGVVGATREERIARSVAAIFDPELPRASRRRRFPPWRKRFPNAHMALARLERRRGDVGAAAAAMRRRIPTEEAIRTGRREGTFTHPAEMVSFQSHGHPVGAEVMRWAHWRGILWLD
jgi:hypothetical protein